MAQALARFTVTPQGDDYLLTIEDDGGQTVELTATAEQLDTLIDAVDDLLAEDDDAFEASEGDGGRA
jgi:hypothetical protein